jgi:hypothetical protein
MYYLDTRVKWSGLRSGRFNPPPSVKRAIDTHWLGSLVDSRVGLEVMEKRNIISVTASNRNPILRSVSP